MMLKLYLQHEGRTEYWEAWSDKGNVVVHRGIVGQTGSDRAVATSRGQSPEAVISQLSEEWRSRGYTELPLENHENIVIQFKTQGVWGDADDLDKRNRVESVLNECLGWTGNGHCDGGDIGSGTINSFCYVVDAVVAVETIVAALTKASLLEGAVIARSDEDDYTVLWPEDYTQEFSIV